MDTPIPQASPDPAPEEEDREVIGVDYARPGDEQTVMTFRWPACFSRLAGLPEESFDPIERAIQLVARINELARLCEIHVAELRRIIQIVHQCHHLDEPGTWETCSRPTCTEIRAYLEKHS